MNFFSEIDSNMQKIVISKIIDLSWQGFGYKKIIKQIAIEFNVKLNLSTLSYWFNNDVLLKGGINKFDPVPSSDLSYVLGVMWGDGNLFNNKKKSDYIIRLDVIDEDFVKHFSKCVSKILSKNKSYAVTQLKHKNMDSIMYSTRARSKELFYFIKECKNDFEKVKIFVEMFPKEFIQGLADSEGCPMVCAKNNFSINVCVAYSTNKELLLFVKKLLEKKFLIKSNFYLSKKAGITDSIINGREITRTKDLFSLLINNIDDLIKFSYLIGFSIKRKNEKLKDAIFIFKKYSYLERSFYWKKIYYKTKKQWVGQLPIKNSTNAKTP